MNSACHPARHPYNTVIVPESKQPQIDLIIPARNEQENIPALAAALPWAIFRHVILVNNGSNDRTAELARQMGFTVVDELRRGYGSACLAGLAWIKAQAVSPPDIVTFVDADLADDPSLLSTICYPIVHVEADFVIAARRKFAEPGSLSVVQHVGNALACGLIKLITGQRYTDLGPMRAIRWSSLQSLSMTDTTWGWTVEMQFKAAVHGLHTLEIDVPYHCRQAGRSKISGTVMGSIRAGWKILATITSLWWETRVHRAKSSSIISSADTVGNDR